MALGRRKSGKQRSDAGVDPYASIGQPEHHAIPTPAPDEAAQTLGSGEGPYDLALLEDIEGLEDGRLDLGSLVLAMPPEAQLQVEMSPEGQPVGVHLDTPAGRITPGVFAAPKTGGQWREVVTELADSLRENGAQVTIEDGHWGREVVGIQPDGVLRFIGVDGPRWMIRFVVAAPAEAAEQAAQLARAMLAETVVRRGTDPRPARDHLEIELPSELVAQLQQAMAQQAQQQEQAAASIAQQVAQRAAAEGPEALRQSNQDRLTRGSALSRLKHQD
ncbi:hypothetical protein TPAU25S_01946 [Tsukamurella paurometabola]|uniref:DUF3710 domain-containing protein n=1 Tax=Tsukamurella paurometabola (strain ATCC 8368 / DSM 20162 / CCUG 35730 / CIP 100753 / JCM 10117 / KCTC 9821 / NBRC 16120 / NCIMB 702349 / NCTC 13040) TaxID=521096 RepID=D5UN01_TSUPD|nr:DUF3710 domain-containing protein [Tsukamurella paurometabola]ADG78498.1 conserved hypothetical protein [Tsukamurella paurometabola DSM 20162]SUP31919.1 Protein of uncharacterised function (DUF3710) [Tsukamurella paurometabola]